MKIISWILPIAVALAVCSFIVLPAFTTFKALLERREESISETATCIEKETLKKRVALHFANAALHDGKYLSQLRAEYYSAIVFYMADIYKVPPNLIMGIIISESNADKGAVSQKGARGLMQVMPAMGKVYRCGDLFDPEVNIECGTHILSDLLAKYHEDAAIKYYLCGESRFRNGCIYSKKAQSYLKTIKLMSKKHKAD